MNTNQYGFIESLLCVKNCEYKDKQDKNLLFLKSRRGIFHYYMRSIIYFYELISLREQKEQEVEGSLIKAVMFAKF